MNDLFSKISEILSNPESAQKIREIASSLSDSPVASAPDSAALPDPATVAPSATPPATPSAGGADLASALSALQSGGSHSRDLTLLNAVRPYLRASRAGKIDNAIKAIRVIDMLSGLR